MATHNGSRTNRPASAVLLATLILLLTGCSAETLTEDISRAEYEAEDKTWPFTIDSGTVKCTEPYIATFVVDDKEYALNIWAQREDWTHDIKQIIADDMDPELDDLDVIRDATDLCDELTS